MFVKDKQSLQHVSVEEIRETNSSSLRQLNFVRLNKKKTKK